MSEVNVSLESSDIPVILEALIFKKAALQDTASEKDESEQQALVVQIDLLINTLSSVSGEPSDAA